MRKNLQDLFNKKDEFEAMSKEEYFNKESVSKLIKRLISEHYKDKSRLKSTKK